MSIQEILQWVFTYVFYPAVAVGVFLYIVYGIVRLISHADKGRTLAGAIVPMAALVFLVISDADPTQSFSDVMSSLSPLVRFLIGFAAAVFVFEMGRWLLRMDVGFGPAVYSLFLSLVAAFLVYCFTAGVILSIQLVMLGLIVGGGLDIVFMGYPSPGQRATRTGHERQR